MALAPIVYLNHAEAWIYKAAVSVLFGQKIYNFTTNMFGSYQALPTMCRSNIDIANIATWLCKSNPLTRYVCQNIIPGVHINPYYDNILDNFKKLSEYYPSGTSAKSLIHLGQLMVLPKEEFKFQKFDYGAQENLIRYGTEKAPAWDVSKLKTKVVIINGEEDFLADRVDVNKLVEVMGGSDKVKLHWIEGWSHITNLFAKNGKPLFDLMALELNDVDK